MHLNNLLQFSGTNLVPKLAECRVGNPNDDSSFQKVLHLFLIEEDIWIVLSHSHSNLITKTDYDMSSKWFRHICIISYKNHIHLVEDLSSLQVLTEGIYHRDHCSIFAISHIWNSYSCMGMV